MMSPDLPYLAKVGILAALYFAGGKLGTSRLWDEGSSSQSFTT